MKVLNIRKKLAQYNEIFYMLYVLPLNICTAVGLTSESKVYMMFFLVGILALFIKLICTNYNIYEFLIMFVITVFLIVIFFHNSEKTLIISALAIWGCKGVSVTKIIRYMLAPRVIFTVLTITAAYFNIIPNQAVQLPKNGEMYTLYCYGYYTPNVLFINLFLIVLLFVEFYQEKLKLIVYLIFGTILYGAYVVLFSRTGFYLYIILCLILGIYKLIKNTSLKKYYLCIFIFLPLLFTIFSFILIFLYQQNNVVVHQLDFVLTGRIRLMADFLDGNRILWIGNKIKKAFDNSYIHIYFNYGIIMLLIVLFAYIKTMIFLWKSHRSYQVLIFGVLAIYGFMEQFPLNVTWNPFLLYISYILFKKNEVKTNVSK